MEFREIHGDLFAADSSFVYSHCISADCRMGAGIAVTFDWKFPQMREDLIKRSPQIGQALEYVGEENGRERRVFNLITKARAWQKPTYDSLRETLINLRIQLDQQGLTNLAIPRIGCGLDKLKWPEVRVILQDLFRDSDVQIVVYSL